MGSLVVVILIAFFVWIIFLQVSVKKQTSIHTSKGKTAVQQEVDEVFGSGWTRINGKGHINLKPKFRAHAPTISINVVPGSSGGSDVTIWLSAWRSRYGAIGHAQLVWRKERALKSRLSDAVGTATLGTSGATASTNSTLPPTTSGTPSSSSNGPASSGGQPTANNAVKARAEYTANPNNPLSKVCKVVADSDYSLIVATAKSPSEIATAFERSITGVQPGSMDHLLVGPPRATMWAYILESTGGTNLLTISLVTQENPDRDYVDKSILAPVRDSLLKAIDGELEIRDSQMPLGPLENRILDSRLVAVAEFKS